MRNEGTNKIPGNTRRTVITVLLVISLIAAAIAVYMVSATLYQYIFAEIEHREIVTETTESTPEGTISQNEISDNEIPVIIMGGKAMPVNLPKVDHKKLAELNPDYFGWLYVPYSNINYPVCLGSDDSLYLDHTFKKKKNTSGCLFLNSKTKENDPIWFIYGHNMKNNTMFGELDEISKSGVNRMYLICPKTTYIFNIYSAHYTKADSDTYSIPLTADAKNAYYDKELKLSEKLFGYIPRVTEKTLVLSTCHGETGGDGRYVVLGSGQ